VPNHSLAHLDLILLCLRYLNSTVNVLALMVVDVD
jgi:hypothetical protein